MKQSITQFRSQYNIRRIKKMSMTISNCDEICQSQLNCSKSKMLFSFSKSARFPQRKRILCDKFYDSHSISPNKTTTFGFGNKYDFTKQSSCAPPPNTYNLSDQFQKNVKKGFGFGEGRNQMLVTGPLMETIRNKNPGPGSYGLEPMFSKGSYSFTGKLHSQDKQKIKIPGPGTYPVTFSISDTGNYFLSKYKSSGVRHFSRLQNRCKTTQNRIPGPGYYDTSKADLSPNGRYAMSKVHNCTSRRFQGFSGRGEIADRKNTPGPGNYKLPSEFGYYIAKKVFRKQASMLSKRSASKQKQEQKQNVAVTDL